MERDIINIDRDLCNGCGVCIPNCHEGALQMIDGKAVLVNDLMCDGLGACIGHCPQGAITIERREAEAYDEIVTLKKMLQESGRNVVAAHLKHLKDFDLKDEIHQALEYLLAHKEEIDFDVVSLIAEVKAHVKGQKNDNNMIKFDNLKSAYAQTKSSAGGCGGGCPGSAAVEINMDVQADTQVSGRSELTQWPVQLHLINPDMPFFKDADMLMAADCAAFAVGDFHSKYLKGKKLAIACPKLDSGQDEYVYKIQRLIDGAGINTLTIIRMQVPCCGGLVQTAQRAAAQAQRKVPIKVITVANDGTVVGNEWI